jgi:hypothetical protein
MERMMARRVVRRWVVRRVVDGWLQQALMARGLRCASMEDETTGTSQMDVGGHCRESVQRTTYLGLLI